MKQNLIFPNGKDSAHTTADPLSPSHVLLFIGVRRTGLGQQSMNDKRIRAVNKHHQPAHLQAKVYVPG